MLRTNFIIIRGDIMKKFLSLALSALVLVSLFSFGVVNAAAGDFETDPVPIVIGSQEISGATVSPVVAKYYTGKAITQNFTVVLGGKTLKENTDYTVSYANNVKVGTATLTITGKGQYKGSLQKKFLINLAKPKVTVTAGTATIKLTYNKVAGATAYAVYQYNTAKKTYNKLATVSELSYTIKNKSAGTSYYYLVRATDGTHASPYSTADNVKAVTLCKAPGVKATVSGKTVVLKIAKPTGAQYFRVYKYNASTKKYTTLVSKTTATSVKLASQPKGTNYYLVRAFNSANAGNTFTTKNLTKAIVK